MWTTLVVCLSLTAYLDAGIICSISQNSAPKDNEIHLLSKTKPFSKDFKFDMDKTLAKIANSCLTDQDHLKLSQNSMGPMYARMFNPGLIIAATSCFMTSEVRAALGFAPLGPWTHFKVPTEEELENATPEQYFNLITQCPFTSLDSGYFLEKNFPPVIAFLDKRIPEIRQVFVHKIEEFVRLHVRQTIDKPTLMKIYGELYGKLLIKVDESTAKMYTNNECKKPSE